MPPAAPPRVASAALVLALGVALAGCGHGGTDAGQPPPLITLEAPKGEVRGVPELFSWRPFAGAASYRVTVSDADTVWPLIRATTAEARMPIPAGRRRAIRPGRIHEWSVEALDARGTVIGSGTVRFWVAAGTPQR